MPPRHSNMHGMGQANVHGVDGRSGKYAAGHNGHGSPSAGETGLKANLISWWELTEDGTNVRVDSGGNNDLTPTGTLAATPAVVGDGSDIDNVSYLRKTTPVSHGSGAMTVCGWFKVIDRDSGGAFINIYRTTTANRQWAFLFIGDGLAPPERNVPRFSVSSDGSNDFSISAESHAEILAGVTFFAIASFDPSGPTIRIEVDDGTSDTNTGPSSLHTGPADLDVGAFSEGLTIGDMVVDQVAYWSRLLTAEEKTFLFNGGSGRSFSDL